MSKIFFSFVHSSSFVKKDNYIFSNHFKTTNFVFNSRSKLLTPFQFFKQFLLIIKGFNREIIFITQFAGYQSVLPTYIGKLFNIKNYIILGGTDCNWLPSISYGNYNKTLLRWATKYSLRNAYHLIPVNKELVECDYTYTNDDYLRQGYKAFIKNINTPYTIIPNGIDLVKYKIKNVNRKKKSFITTCSELQDSKRRLVKGVDLIIELARLNLDCTFTILGGEFPSDIELPINITTYPFIENELLPDFYNQYEFYFQLSLTEGFPNALIEAMACGCVPIVSKVGAMPDIITKVGYTLNNKDVNQLNQLVKVALNEYDEKKPLTVRKKAEMYDIKNREIALLNLLNSPH